MTAIRYALIVLHIIAAGIWIAQLAAEFGFRLAMRGSKGKPVELPLMMAQGRVLGLMGQIGGIGILLTGFGLLWADGYALLGIGGFTPTWLMIKQVVYLVALGTALFILQPMQKRLIPQFVAAAKGTPTVTPEIQAMFGRLTNISRFINVLVIVNIILAVWKPT